MLRTAGLGRTGFTGWEAVKARSAGADRGMEAGKDAVNVSGVSKKSIAHRDFAAFCCYLQILTPLGRETSETDDRTARTRHRDERAGLQVLRTAVLPPGSTREIVGRLEACDTAGWKPAVQAGRCGARTCGRRYWGGQEEQEAQDEGRRRLVGGGDRM